MNALRLDFMRDGVRAEKSEIAGLYNEACQKGYRPACGWQAWRDEDGANLLLAGEIFTPLCSRKDALACVVKGWVHEHEAKREAEPKERDRAYVLAAKHYKIACDTAGLTGIAGCYELAEMRAKGMGMSISTQAAYDL